MGTQTQTISGNEESNSVFGIRKVWEAIDGPGRFGGLILVVAYPKSACDPKPLPPLKDLGGYAPNGCACVCVCVAKEGGKKLLASF